MEAAKTAAVKGDWAAVAAMEGPYPEELADEFQALFAKAYLSMAKSTQSDAAAAAVFLRKAAEYADKGLYANASVKAEAVILLQQAAVFLSV